MLKVKQHFNEKDLQLYQVSFSGDSSYRSIFLFEYMSCRGLIATNQTLFLQAFINLCQYVL